MTVAPTKAGGRQNPDKETPLAGELIPDLRFATSGMTARIGIVEVMDKGWNEAISLNRRWTAKAKTST